MAKKPIDIGSRQFSMKGDAKAHFKAMLARYRDGERLNEQDALDLHGLLRRHPEYTQKIGVGLNHFIVDENREHERVTRSFWVVRKDMSIDDVSYIYCINLNVA